MIIRYWYFYVRHYPSPSYLVLPFEFLVKYIQTFEVHTISTEMSSWPDLSFVYQNSFWKKWHVPFYFDLRWNYGWGSHYLKPLDSTVTLTISMFQSFLITSYWNIWSQPVSKEVFFKHRKYPFPSLPLVSTPSGCVVNCCCLNYTSTSSHRPGIFVLRLTYFILCHSVGLW